MNWISVKDRIPEEGKPVLVTGEIPDVVPYIVGIADLKRTGKFWIYNREWQFEPTHWMPLPEPPKETT